MNKGTLLLWYKRHKSEQPYHSILPTVFYLTTSMEHGSWEKKASLDVTDFLRIMCNSNIHCRVHKTTTLTCRLCPMPYEHTLKSFYEDLLSYFPHKYICIFKLLRRAASSSHSNQNPLNTFSFCYILSMTRIFNWIIIFLHVFPIAVADCIRGTLIVRMWFPVFNCLNCVISLKS